jgi:HK97 family phage major capsid protein
MKILFLIILEKAMNEDRNTSENRIIEETRTAVQELIKGFQDYQGRIETKLRVQEDRLALLDRRDAGRPALAHAAETDTPHRKALAAYIRTGDESGLRALDTKMLSTVSAGEGGMLLDTETVRHVEQVRACAHSLRAVAKVVQVEAGSYELLVNRGPIDTEWTGEMAAVEESVSEAFERISIPLHELSAMPRASQRLLDDSAFDVELWLAEAIAERFAHAENVAFMKGKGPDQPTGLLSYPTAPFATAEWGQIGVVSSGVDGGFDAADPSDTIIDLVYALDAKYRAGASFVMSSGTAAYLRKFKDVDGRFLWAETLCAGQPTTLMGYPVVINEEMPAIGSGLTPIAFGNFRAGYTIVEKPGLRILRDPYSVKPHVQFYATTRVGGAVTDFSAIRLLQLSAV